MYLGTSARRIGFGMFEEDIAEGLGDLGKFKLKKVIKKITKPVVKVVKTGHAVYTGALLGAVGIKSKGALRTMGVKSVKQRELARKVGGVSQKVVVASAIIGTGVGVASLGAGAGTGVLTAGKTGVLTAGKTGLLSKASGILTSASKLYGKGKKVTTQAEEFAREVLPEKVVEQAEQRGAELIEEQKAKIEERALEQAGGLIEKGYEAIQKQISPEREIGGYTGAGGGAGAGLPTAVEEAEVKPLLAGFGGKNALMWILPLGLIFSLMVMKKKKR